MIKLNDGQGQILSLRVHICLQELRFQVNSGNGNHTFFTAEIF